jgi:ketol-acid reductoisomerase
VKQVADLIYERGLAGMMRAISSTAEFGAHHAGPRVIDSHVRLALGRILHEIRAGTFARQLQADHAAGSPWCTRQRRELESHPIEAAGRLIRSIMHAPQVEGGGPSAT